MKRINAIIKSLFAVKVYDISNCPFTPDRIEGHEVICIHGNKAICA